MKSHTPECGKIEQFAAALSPMKRYYFCVQDFDSKDYTLVVAGRSVVITQRQYVEGAWQEILRNALPSRE